MPCRLTPDAISRYHRDGYLAPLSALPGAEMAAYLDRLTHVEQGLSGRLPPTRNVKAHLLLPWLWDLVHDPRILDPVEDVLGADVLCWASGFFDKRPGEPHHVPWHQDATYWGLAAPDALTAWIAFTPSHPGNGGLRVVPGTHGTLLAHGDTRDKFNMLPGRETVLTDVDEASAVDIVLQPGEMSLHHVRLFHGSEPNRSDLPRIGFAIRYIPTYIRQTTEARDSATLVSGTDEFGHFDPEPRPRTDFDPECVAFHKAMLENAEKILYAGAAKVKHFTAAEPRPGM